MRALPDLQAEQLALFDTDTITIFRRVSPVLSLWHLKDARLPSSYLGVAA